MNTLRLEVGRGGEHSLITKDRMRVEVTVEFFVRVIPAPSSVGCRSAQLGHRTMNPESLKDLVQGRFVDAMGLRGDDDWRRCTSNAAITSAA